ncbi:hypothetical protein NDI49_12690 [Trichocoleus sp. ST-U3]
MLTQLSKLAGFRVLVEGGRAIALLHYLSARKKWNHEDAKNTKEEKERAIALFPFPVCPK